MKLDRTTYEAWLLDRIEGNLSPERERELDAFLAANPDLRAGAGALPSVEAGATAIDWSHTAIAGLGDGAKNELKKTFPPTGEPDATRLNDFLAARVEKDLTADQEKALDRFIYEHPGAQRDAALMNASKVPTSSVPFDQKDTLEKHFPPQGMPDAHRLIDFLIAEQEGDLSREQGAALKQFLAQHPEAGPIQKMVAAARVTPERVIYEQKEKLKKREVRVITLWPRLAVAASIALLLGFAWWVLRDRTNEPEVAVKEKQAPTSTDPNKNTPAVKNVPPELHQQQNTDQPKPSPGIANDSSIRQGPQRANDASKHLPEKPLKDQAPMQQNEQPAPEPLAPAPEPQLVEQPAPIPQPQQAPALAQEHPQATPAVQAEQHPSTASTPTLPALLANTVRSGVLDSPQRSNGLDGDDAVAAVDKGLRAVSGGDATLKVDRTATREHLRLRLGRGFAVSASRGR